MYYFEAMTDSDEREAIRAEYEAMHDEDCQEAGFCSTKRFYHRDACGCDWPATPEEK